MQTQTKRPRVLGSAALAVALVLLAGPGQAQPASVRSSQMSRAGGQYFRHNGSRIFYQVAGHGQPIVLIHGYPLSGELFRHQRTGLSDRFKVVTLDLPGYGRSTAATATSSIGDYVKDVIALMDHLHLQKAIIGGHSMGGVITMELYKEVPQRFNGMILIDTNPMPAPIVGAAQWNAYATQAQQKGVASTVALLLPQMLTGETRANEPAVANELKGIVLEASVKGFVAGGHALADRADYRQLIKTIKVPTLILVGVDDPLWAVPLDQMMHAAIPNSKLSILPAASHASIFEKPQEANDAIRSWAAGVSPR